MEPFICELIVYCVDVSLIIFVFFCLLLHIHQAWRLRVNSCHGNVPRPFLFNRILISNYLIINQFPLKCHTFLLGIKCKHTCFDQIRINVRLLKPGPVKIFNLHHLQHRQEKKQGSLNLQMLHTVGLLLRSFCRLVVFICYKL